MYSPQTIGSLDRTEQFTLQVLLAYRLLQGPCSEQELSKEKEKKKTKIIAGCYVLIISF